MRKGLFVLMIVVMLLTMTTLPALADSPGTGSSNFVIQNVDATQAQVSIDYLDQTGTTDYSTSLTIAGRGSQVFDVATQPLGDGWIGSVVVASDKEVASVTNLTWLSTFGSADDRITGGSYSGAHAPTTSLFLPYATVKPAGSLPGKLIRFSIVTVQNAGTVNANIQMHYYNQATGQLTGPIADTIQAGRSKSYNLSNAADPKVPNLGGDWQGSVYVSSDQPIAGVVTTHWAQFVYAQWASAYQGASSGDTLLYGPSVFRVSQAPDGTPRWIRSSNVLVQNAGDAPASVTVKFYETGSATPKMTISDTIGPKQHKEYHTRFGVSHPAANFQTQLGERFFGSVVVEGNQPLAGVVHTFWHQAGDNAASTYQLVPGGATTAYVPYAPRKRTPAAWVEMSKIAIQNLSTSSASVTLTYYNLNGTVAATINDTIAGSSGDAYDTRFGSDGGNIAPGAFAPLGDSFAGSVVINSTQPIAVVSNLRVQPIWASTYNAYTP